MKRKDFSGYFGVCRGKLLVVSLRDSCDGVLWFFVNKLCGGQRLELLGWVLSPIY